MSKQANETQGRSRKPSARDTCYSGVTARRDGNPSTTEEMMNKPKQPAKRGRPFEDLRIRGATPEALARAVTRGGAPKRQETKPKR